MSNILIVYWSGTGNTEKASELAGQGAERKGAVVTRKRVGDTKASELAEYDVIAFGSPSMGTEVIEEAEMEPFFSEALPFINGKKTALFGSYGWGNGEWLRTWADRVREAGGNLMDDGLAVHEAPCGDSEAACLEWGEKLAAF